MGLAVKVDTSDVDTLTGDLGKLATGLDRELRRVSADIARQIAGDARSKARSLGGVAGHSAPGVSGEETAAGGEVVLDGARYPTVLGAEFGGRGRPTTQQFQPHRGTENGYFLYPTLRASEDQTDEAYVEALDEAFKEAGFR